VSAVSVPPRSPVSDQRIAAIEPLQPPEELLGELPLSERGLQVVLEGRRAVTRVLDGEDDRLIVVVGPCSVHDPAAALDYARRLAAAAEQHREQLCVVMRVYFEKPRTTIGWKGLINDPGLDGGFHVGRGLHLARRLLLDILDLGLPVGCEFLDPITAQYITDTVTWGSIGARTAESQVHRQLCSGLSMPVGIKNATSGDVQAAVDAVGAAAHSHTFPGIGADGRAAIFATTGNRDCHVILRGGSIGPNYDPQSVAGALERLERAGLPPRVIIDASHANSGKDHRRQPAVIKDVADRLADGERGVVGVMLESFLVAGRQTLVLGETDGLVYGQSVTDACLDWETTASMLARLAAAVGARRE
jgi:3-deoxy-7-phosphoheptulonate synthase